MVTNEHIWTNRETDFILGTVITSNADRWTVDFRSEMPQELELTDVPILSPYYCFVNGHGLLMIPESGSTCLVVRHQSDYFVLGFLPPPDVTTTLPKQEATQNLLSPFSQQVTDAQKLADSGNGDVTPGRQSYRSNREGDMLPGDGVAKTKAGNKFKWLTDGTLLAEASKLCSTTWSRLKNTIVNVCINFRLVSPGVFVDIATDDVTENKKINFKIQVAKSSKDAAPSVLLETGFDADVFKLTIQTPSKEKRHEFRIAADGTVTQKIGNNLASPDISITYANNGDITEAASNNVARSAGSEYNITATTRVKVDAPTIELGPGALDALVKSTALQTKFNTHTHIVNSIGAPTAPPNILLDSTDATTNVKAS